MSSLLDKSFTRRLIFFLDTYWTLGYLRIMENAVEKIRTITTLAKVNVDSQKVYDAMVSAGSNFDNGRVNLKDLWAAVSKVEGK